MVSVVCVFIAEFSQYSCNDNDKIVHAHISRRAQYLPTAANIHELDLACKDHKMHHDATVAVYCKNGFNQNVSQHGFRPCPNA